MHGGRLLTLFSARDYLKAGSNDSALLLAAFDADGALRIRPKRLVRSLAAAATRMVPPALAVCAGGEGGCLTDRF
jgi:hypothetical protein